MYVRRIPPLRLRFSGSWTTIGLSTKFESKVSEQVLNIYQQTQFSYPPTILTPKRRMKIFDLNFVFINSCLSIRSAREIFQVQNLIINAGKKLCIFPNVAWIGPFQYFLHLIVFSKYIVISRRTNSEYSGCLKMN